MVKDLVGNHRDISKKDVLKIVSEKTSEKDRFAIYFNENNDIIIHVEN